jgi:hypothetical protein
MLDKLFDIGGVVIKQVGELSHMQWLMVMALAVVVGLVCLRGYGSRKSY